MTEQKDGTIARRTILMGGVAALMPAVVRSEPLKESVKHPGGPLTAYGQPSLYEAGTTRSVVPLFGEMAPGVAAAYTPLERLAGVITPNGLHFARTHGGVPDIDPHTHKLLIHGKVGRNLTFDRATLDRYPMATRTCFIECSGNSFQHSLSQPRQLAVGEVHGLFSTAEWTGVPLSVLLEEAQIEMTASWLLVEGADSDAMSRSLPMSKALKDCFVALYQNGERLRPEHGYPMRLIVPGWQGNLHIKWLRRIKVTDGPTHTRDETSRYSLLMPDGRAREFPFEMPVKSLITHPSYGQILPGPGQYEISGLAWTGSGTIVAVEISLDGGKTWAKAAFDATTQEYIPRRFRYSWQWDGKPVVLQSRASDSQGNIQPSHVQWKEKFHHTQRFHCNAIQSWSIEEDGVVENVFL
jgi:sulfane dehydrogenase subunit SoxC